MKLTGLQAERYVAPAMQYFFVEPVCPIAQSEPNEEHTYSDNGIDSLSENDFSW